MKFSILSDTHFGDRTGTLVSKTNEGKFVQGPLYSQFKNAAGSGNDFLIMLGDILDFSIVSYKEAYEAAKSFFIQIMEDEIADEIIYVPGNHDADIWHTVEYEVNVIERMNKGKLPRKFRMSVPGIIDLRNSSAPSLKLAGVSERRGDASPKYAGLFLDQITSPEFPPLPFNFAFPNLYIITENESILLTHGHYFEAFWTFLSEWGQKVFSEDLPIGENLDLAEMVGINFPQNQLGSAGIGQAGPLTEIVNRLQNDIKNGNVENFKKYLDRLDNEVDRNIFKYSPVSPMEWGTDLFSNYIKKFIIDKLKNYNSAKFNDNFIYLEQVRERIRKYFNLTLREIDSLNQNHNYQIPYPDKIIFGHTHEPIAWNTENPPVLSTEKVPDVKLYNCGGWITGEREGKIFFPGAEVFVYDSNSGFSSSRIQFAV